MALKIQFGVPPMCAALHPPVVTIAGGSGFLGRYVVKRLAQEGYVIRVLTRDPEAAKHLKTSGHVGQIVLEGADFTRPETLKGKLENSWAVINLVGTLYEKGRQNFNNLHAQGAERLAQMAREAGAQRYVHVSALGIEQATTSKYARTKLLGEKATMAAFPQATIFRPSVLFGPEDQFFNKFATMACYLPFIPLMGAETRFQPVYVADVAEAVARSLANPMMEARTYELGGPFIQNLRQIVEFVLQTTARSAMIIRVPLGIALLLSGFMELAPKPPLTRDQVRLLQHDNVIAATARTFRDIGIVPSSFELIAPSYLERFRLPSAASMLTGEER